MSSDPVLIAYGVKQRASTGRNAWTRIGEAYPHDEGAGLTLVLSAVPLNGRIVLLEPDATDDERHAARSARMAAARRGTGVRSE